MNLDQLKPKFNFTIAILEGYADKAGILYIRDKTILNDFSFDDDAMDVIVLKTQQLRIFPSDDAMVASIKDVVEIKDKYADDVKISIRDIMVRVEKVFAPGTGNYARFQTKGMSKLTDLELVVCAQNVAYYADKFIDQISSKGVTPEMITALSDLAVTFQLSITAVYKAEIERTATTHDRIELANSLYDCISEMFSYGKAYWSSRNYAKYKDYVIYNTPSGNPDLSGETVTFTGTMADILTSLPVLEGEIIFEYLNNPVTVGEDGKYVAENVPVECTKVWGTALAHMTYYRAIEVIPGGENHLDINMQPGHDNPPPPSV